VKGHRSHRATSDDGTQIVGSVRGPGPPLVFVHGALADGELEWDEVVPHLAGRFTCHMMSTRGRGASRDAADHSLPRLVEDVVGCAESIAEPAWSASPAAGGSSSESRRTRAGGCGL
jgi:pimeloyl-ACP methyl ester carboxylesterase